MIYIINEKNESLSWRHDLFGRISRIAENKYANSKVFSEEEDFVQEIKLSIWNSILTFDYKRNFDFFRWLHWNVAKGIRESFSSNDRLREVKSSLRSGGLSCEYADENALATIIDIENYPDSRSASVLVRSVVNGETLSEIGKDLGISAERVRQIKRSIINDLQAGG